MRHLRPLHRCLSRPILSIRSGLAPHAPARYILTRRALATATSLPATPDDIYDVVIVGGGPAGLSLATALKSSNLTSSLKIALLDAQDLTSAKSWPTRAEPGVFENRCSSLTPGSVEFLRRIGAWEGAVRKERVQAVGEMKVWDGVSNTDINFLTPASSGAEEGAIAYITENANLVSSLLSRLASAQDFTLLDRTKVSQITYGADTGDLDLSAWPVVHASNGQKLAARLLVGADGANSPVRTFAEIESRGWDYGRQGVVATLQLEEGSAAREIAAGGRTAYQRFLPEGPVALLPLPNDNASLVWSTTPAIATLLKSLPPDILASTINAAFRLLHNDLTYILSLPASEIPAELSWRLSLPFETPAHLHPPLLTSITAASVASFPLKFRHADTYIAPRLALVGDAAHTMHPLAGQGLNQGLADVEALVANVEGSVREGADLGDVLRLEGYVAQRYWRNHVVHGAVDKLEKVYGTAWGPVVGVRSLGLWAVDRMGFVKEGIMRAAAGR